MSGKFGTALMFVGLMALAWVSYEPSATRSPASLGPSVKAKSFALSKGDVLKHTKKLRGPLSAKVALRGAKPEEPGDTFVLVGEILSESNLSEVTYEFNLPADVELINGVVKGKIQNIVANEPREIELTLKQNAFDNKQIHLVASGSKGGMIFADSAQFNTLLEEQFRTSQKELLESTEQNAPRYKVFH